jgi:TetR/AcrR family transcriptional regulator, transcriptional repressor for nem operon
MRYDAEHKQKTRERVLKEAAKAIRAQGPYKIGVAEVMAKAGLTHGGFYAHFQSKDDFVNAAVGQMFAEGQARLNQSLKADTPHQALSDYLDFYLSKAHRDTRTAGCPLPFLAADAPRMDDAFRAQYAGGVARLTQKLGEPLSALGHQDAVEIAGSILAEMVGALALARAEPDPARSDAILARSLRSVRARAGLETQA